MLTGFLGAPGVLRGFWGFREISGLRWFGRWSKASNGGRH